MGSALLTSEPYKCWQHLGVVKTPAPILQLIIVSKLIFQVAWEISLLSCVIKGGHQSPATFFHHIYGCLPDLCTSLLFLPVWSTSANIHLGMLVHFYPALPCAPQNPFHHYISPSNGYYSHHHPVQVLSSSIFLNHILEQPSPVEGLPDGGSFPKLLEVTRLGLRTCICMYTHVIQATNLRDRLRECGTPFCISTDVYLAVFLFRRASQPESSPSLKFPFSAHRKTFLELVGSNF